MSVSVTDAEPGNTTWKIGDRVMVSGSKPGVVAYIGVTQFAAGEWVGIELDSPLGKNDGSVSGVRYFTCKALHGVFAKASKLTRLSSDTESSVLPTQSDTSNSSCTEKTEAAELVSPAFSASDAPESATEITSQSISNVACVMSTAATSPSDELVMGPPTIPSPVESVKESPVTLPENPEKNGGSSSEQSSSISGGINASKKSIPASSAPKSSGLIPRPMHGSTMSLSRMSVTNSTVDLNATIGETPVKHNLKIGDRVSVGGNKVGILRFIGSTEFAKGEWAGVELDEPVGKNDGSVHGKR
jgi:hypothetical protein